MEGLKVEAEEDGVCEDKADAEGVEEDEVEANEMGDGKEMGEIGADLRSLTVWFKTIGASPILPYVKLGDRTPM
jgi:hypothetical protein